MENHMNITAPSHSVAENGKIISEGPLNESDYLKVKKAALVLRAINHKLRQQIVKTIYEHRRISVTDLYVRLRLEQSVASQHLAILRRADIVSTIREGKFIFYTVNQDRIEEIMTFVKSLVD